MEIRTLRYFLEVAREENMSKAAERLHLSQSTLSKQLKGLEYERRFHNGKIKALHHFPDWIIY